MQAFESSIVFRSLAFGYANARVKAMRQNLFTGRELGAMADAKSMEEIYSILEKTQYKQDIPGAAPGRSVSDIIELALTKNFSRTLAKINKVSPDFVKKRVAGFFERYDANNAKIIILGKHLGQAPEEIRQYIVEGGAISKGAIERAINAKSLKEAAYEFAGTDYGSPISKGYVEYEKTRQISAILQEIDSTYFSRLPELAKQSFGDARILLKILKTQIDAKNISNILRSKRDLLGEEKTLKLIIDGGNIAKDRLGRAAGAKSVEEAAKVFENNFDFRKAIEDYRKTGSIIPFELAMEKAISAKSLSLLRTSVLSIGAIIGFVLLKEEEISNVRKIVRAKEFNLPAGKLQEIMVTG